MELVLDFFAFVMLGFFVLSIFFLGGSGATAVALQSEAAVDGDRKVARRCG